MHADVALLAATAGCGLSGVGTWLYLRDIRRGRTRPHRGSWLVWGVIAVVAAASNGADGGRWSLVALSAQALGTLTVLLTSLRHGVGWLTRGNVALLAVATGGVLGWKLLADPAMASACAAVADGAGLVAIVPKAWRDPHSETMATYALAAVSGMMTALAVGSWDGSLLLFPLYFCLANGTTAAYLGWRRRLVLRAVRCSPV